MSFLPQALKLAKIKSVEQSRFTVLLYVLISTLALSCFPAHAQNTNDDLRKNIRDMWQINKFEISDQRLNEILQSNYPNTQTPWRNIIFMVYTSDQVLKWEDSKSVESLLPRLNNWFRYHSGEFIYDRSIGLAENWNESLKKKAVETALKKVGLGTLTKAYGRAEIYRKVLEKTVITTDKVALSNQIKLYIRAREQKETHQNIVGGSDTEVVAFSDDKWIIGLLHDNGYLSYSLLPRGLTPKEVWDIGQLFWNTVEQKQEMRYSKSEVEKQLREVARIGAVGSYLSASAPIIVIDRSGSLTDKPGVMRQIQRKADEVVKTIQSSVTEAAIINFSGQNNSNVDADFTSDPDILKAAIERPSVSNSGTAVYDAIAKAVEQAGKRDQTTMIVLLTDGVNHGGRNIDEAIKICQSSNPPVPVLIVGFEGTEGRNDKDLLRLAESTGGFYVKDEQGLLSSVLDRFHFYTNAKRESRPVGRPD